jgi:DTW domain-containing protein YfiP
MNTPRPFHLLLKELEKVSFLEFTREPQWSQDKISCDCAGLITLLLKEQGVFPESLGPRPKVKDYFKWLNDSPLKKSTINELERYDVLLWKKDRPPKSGDTGHILLLLSRPRKKTDTTYELNILEINRFEGLAKRKIEIITFKDGRLKGIAWQPNSHKVKETTIIGACLFKREECRSCSYIKELCQCELLPQDKPKAPPIIILRHPSEKKHPLATVKLLQQYFEDLTVEDGEIFSPRKGILLYPDDPDQNLSHDRKICFSVNCNQPLIIIDATWKKSHRILKLNPWLKELPRFSLKNYHSQYFLRRPKGEHYLSSLESFCYSIQEFYPQDGKMKNHANDLLRLFDDFIAKRKKFYPKETLEQFYRARDFES